MEHRSEQAVVLEFPLTRPLPEYERTLLAGGLPATVPGICNVCGNAEGFALKSANFREELRCKVCHSFNRKRQIAAVLLTEIGAPREATIRSSLRLLPEAIWIMETGPYAEAFAAPTLFTSEYLSPDLVSGQVRKGVRHEDATNPSFADNSLDMIISSDVFEHIPDPYQAHRRLFACLKPGGTHIFTVPFFAERACDEIRATCEGGKDLYVREPEYHGDPVRGRILVYRIFGIEMLVTLERIGYGVKMLRVRDPRCGILDTNGLVFVARKPH